MTTSRSRALGALELHAQLRERLRTPAWQQIAEDYLAAEPSTAATGESPREWCERMVSALTVALTFHVEPEMVPLVQWAGADLPADTVVEHSMLAAEAGMLVLGEELPFRGVVPLRIAAVSWTIGSRHHRLHSAGGVWVTWWARPSLERIRTGRAAHRALHPGAAFATTDEEELAAQFGEGRLRLVLRQFLPWGAVVGPPLDVGFDPATGEVDVEAVLAGPDAGMHALAEGTLGNLTRTMVALWLLLGQSVVDASEEPLTPGQARGWARRKIPPRVVVVRLRHVGSRRREGESTVAWSHRWLVRGHWRRQPFGPDRSQRRMVWIAPHIKGPEGAELITPQKVYDLRR